eukprot:scaffold262320_cov31-Tisochrysis_lutea.AAC.1
MPSEQVGEQASPTCAAGLIWIWYGASVGRCVRRRPGAGSNKGRGLRRKGIRVGYPPPGKGAHRLEGLGKAEKAPPTHLPGSLPARHAARQRGAQAEAGREGRVCEKEERGERLIHSINPPLPPQLAHHS